MLIVSTVETDSNTTLFRLEGRIIGSWVDELRKTCEENLSNRKQIVLDVSMVSFVDEQGVGMLQSLAHRNVKLTGCSLFLSELLNSVSANSTES